MEWQADPVEYAAENRDIPHQGALTRQETAHAGQGGEGFNPVNLELPPSTFYGVLIL